MATFKPTILNFKKSDGTTNIKIRTTHKRKITYLSTDIFVKPNEFNSTTGLVRSGKYKEQINRKLTFLLNEYHKKYLTINNPQILSADQIKSQLTSNYNEQIDFIEFSQDYIGGLEKQNTADWYRTTISVLQKFKSKVYINDINVNLLKDFEQYMYNSGVRNGANNYLRGIRVLFNKAIEKYNDEDIGVIKIPHYPFRKFKIKTIELDTIENCLSADALRKLLDYQPTFYRDEIARDIFMLMIYFVGINSIDLFFLPPNEKDRIVYNRSKTAKKISIKIEPEARQIMEKYKGTKRLLYFYHRYSMHKNFTKAVNKGLERISNHLGFKRKVTTNWARHTWATIARNECRIYSIIKLFRKFFSYFSRIRNNICPSF